MNTSALMTFTVFGMQSDKPVTQHNARAPMLLTEAGMVIFGLLIQYHCATLSLSVEIIGLLAVVLTEMYRR